MSNQIYIANLSKYVEGKLVGEWVKLPIDEEDLKKEIASILGNDEEYAIHDYELPFNVGEYDSPYDINKVLQIMEEKGIENDVMEIYSDNFDLYDFDKLDDLEYSYIEDVSNYTELANKLVDEGLYFSITIPQELEGYINYEAIGRDINCNGEWIITNNNNAVCITSNL